MNHVIFPLPSDKGKGVLISKTTGTTYIVGPSSEPVSDNSDLSTDKMTLDNIKSQANLIVDSIPFNKCIRAFSGLRATCSRHDFVIEQDEKYSHFINIGGIESPGLVSSPAIAKYVVEELVKKLIKLEPKPSYNPRIKPYTRLKDLDIEQRNEIIKKNKDYGRIICFCEQISLGEVKEALSRSVPPRSIKAMKKRVRAGFGRCQGGFCQSNILKEIANHYGVAWSKVNYDEENTNILLDSFKGACHDK